MFVYIFGNKFSPIEIVSILRFSLFSFAFFPQPPRTDLREHPSAEPVPRPDAKDPTVGAVNAQRPIALLLWPDVALYVSIGFTLDERTSWISSRILVTSSIAFRCSALTKSSNVSYLK